jgi:demethylmenaquinone methyltransferase/2-methoxy-6-polyprenyl-1,4-benzoquinol methylase
MPDSRAAPVWDFHALRDPHRQNDKATRIQAMFDAIAPSYERVNQIASFGQDAAWRRRAIAAAAIRAGDCVLDLCCGTGDMLRAMAQSVPAPGRLIGVDFAAGMLTAGRYPTVAAPPIHLIRADATRLPLADASVDVVTCAFGVRNFQNLANGLHEMTRVLRPGGRLVILEFATPEFALLRWAHGLYCNVILPTLGRLISRDRTGAYRYLPRSIETFEPPERTCARLRELGLHDIQTRRMNLGGVILFSARKPH